MDERESLIKDLDLCIENGTGSKQVLIAARAALAATQVGWISVKDRLPEKGAGVLCAVEFDRSGDWRIKVGGLLPDPDFNEWQVFGASWTPTHWMPLPAAPESSVASKEEQK